MQPFRRFLLATLLITCLTPLQARACPNCKEAIESQTGDTASMKDGYFYSILFMVAMPFTLLGTGTYLVTKAVRQGGLPEM